MVLCIWCIMVLCIRCIMVLYIHYIMVIYTLGCHMLVNKTRVPLSSSCIHERIHLSYRRHYTDWGNVNHTLILYTVIPVLTIHLCKERFNTLYNEALKGALTVVKRITSIQLYTAHIRWSWRQLCAHGDIYIYIYIYTGHEDCYTLFMVTKCCHRRTLDIMDLTVVQPLGQVIQVARGLHQ